MNDMKTQSIGFLIFDGFPMACLTSMIEPLRAANEISGQDAFSWTLMAETMDKICSSAGVNFEPDMVLGQAEGPGYLFLLSPPMAGFSNPKVGYGALMSNNPRGKSAPYYQLSVASRLCFLVATVAIYIAFRIGLARLVAPAINEYQIL
jgi:hypothetical protein